MKDVPLAVKAASNIADLTCADGMRSLYFIGNVKPFALAPKIVIGSFFLNYLLYQHPSLTMEQALYP